MVVEAAIVQEKGIFFFFFFFFLPRLVMGPIYILHCKQPKREKGRGEGSNFGVEWEKRKEGLLAPGSLFIRQNCPRHGRTLLVQSNLAQVVRTVSEMSQLTSQGI